MSALVETRTEVVAAIESALRLLGQNKPAIAAGHLYRALKILEPERGQR